MLAKKTIFLAASVGLASVGQSAAASDITIRFAHWLPETHPLAEHSFPDWSESITEASGGSIQFEYYPAEQLGRAADHYDMVSAGIADVAWVNPGYTTGRFPVISALEYPFVFSDGTTGSSAAHEWYEKYAKEEMSDVKVCITHINDPGTLHTNEEVRAPSDLRGLNIRPSSGSTAALVRASGGANVQVAAPEAREALERGTADGIFYPNGSFWLYGLDQAATYHLDFPMYTNAAVWVMNNNTYNSMTEDQKSVIDQHCTPEWAARVAKPWNDFEAEGLQRLRDEDGQTMVSLTDDEMQDWIEAVEPLVDRWKEEVSSKGHDADVIWSELAETLKKHDAEFAR